MGLFARLVGSDSREPEPSKRMVGADRLDVPSPRQALAAHLEAEHDIRERLAQLSGVTERAADAAAREAAAEEALEQLAELEAQDWKLWSSSGTGRPPLPRTDERDRCATILAEAHNDAIERKRWAEFVHGSCCSTAERLQALVAERPGLIAPVLVAEAEKVADTYADLLYRSARCEAALRGLRAALLELGRSADSERVARLLREGPIAPGAPHGDSQERLQQRHQRAQENAAIQRAAAEMGKRLAADSSVSLDEVLDAALGLSRQEHNA